MGIPSYLHYSDSDFCKEFLADMERPCPIDGATDGHLRIKYDVSRYDFRTIVADLLLEKNIIIADYQGNEGLSQLENLHRFVAPKNQVLSDTQQSAAAVALYDINRQLNDLYLELIRDIVAPALGVDDVYWQSVPTFRVFFAHSVGYPGQITYHNDVMLGHNPREINIFLPLTSCEASRSLLLAPLGVSQDLCRSYDYNFTLFAEHTQTSRKVQEHCAAICLPVIMDVGEVMIFDGRCLHAGPPNMTDKSRVTADFRLLSKEAIKGQVNQYQGTGRRKAVFAPGGAFSSQTISEKMDVMAVS